MTTTTDSPIGFRTKKVKGSCSRGHKWEGGSMSQPPSIQFHGFLGLDAGKSWCVLCIEEKLEEIGIGTTD